MLPEDSHGLRTEGSTRFDEAKSGKLGVRIVYSAGLVNFLDRSQRPAPASRIHRPEIRRLTGTMQAKAKVIRETLGLIGHHPD